MGSNFSLLALLAATLLYGHLLLVQAGPAKRPAGGTGASNQKKSGSKEMMDGLTKEWKNISEFWCYPENLPEEILDSVYECFRIYKGNKEFLAQIRCENEIFHLNMTKNDVRRKLCQNDKQTVGQFEKCFTKYGINSSAANKAITPQQSRQQQQQAKKNQAASRAQMQKFKELTICMRKAIKWQRKPTDKVDVVAVDEDISSADGPPSSTPSAPQEAQ